MTEIGAVHERDQNVVISRGKGADSVPTERQELKPGVDQKDRRNRRDPVGGADGLSGACHPDTRRSSKGRGWCSSTAAMRTAAMMCRASIASGSPTSRQGAAYLSSNQRRGKKSPYFCEGTPACDMRDWWGWTWSTSSAQDPAVCSEHLRGPTRSDDRDGGRGAMDSYRWFALRSYYLDGQAGKTVFLWPEACRHVAHVNVYCEPDRQWPGHACLSGVDISVEYRGRLNIIQTTGGRESIHRGIGLCPAGKTSISAHSGPG